MDTRHLMTTKQELLSLDGKVAMTKRHTGGTQAHYFKQGGIGQKVLGLNK